MKIKVDKVKKAKIQSRTVFADSRSTSTLIVKDKSKYTRKQKHKVLSAIA